MLKYVIDSQETIREKFTKLFDVNLNPAFRDHITYSGQPEHISWYSIVYDVYAFERQACDAATKVAGVSRNNLAFNHLDRGLHDRYYKRFGLFCEELGRYRAKDDYIRQLPCMKSGTPTDSHPVWKLSGGEHSFMHCYMDELLGTDWDSVASNVTRESRRSIMSQDCIDTLESLRTAAGVNPLENFRILISFDS